MQPMTGKRPATDPGTADTASWTDTPANSSRTQRSGRQHAPIARIRDRRPVAERGSGGNRGQVLRRPGRSHAPLTPRGTSRRSGPQAFELQAERAATSSATTLLTPCRPRPLPRCAWNASNRRTRTTDRATHPDAGGERDSSSPPRVLPSPVNRPIQIGNVPHDVPARDSIGTALSAHRERDHLGRRSARSPHQWTTVYECGAGAATGGSRPFRHSSSCMSRAYPAPMLPAARESRAL